MKHCIAIANKTQTEAAVDTVMDRYQSLHRLVDEPIWYVDCDGETRYGHDYGHVPEVDQNQLWTGFFWALSLEITIGLAIIAGIWIWRLIQ